MDDIDKFNLYAGATLAKLYRSFPRPIPLWFEILWQEVPRPDDMRYHDEIPADEKEKEVNLVASTVKWLNDNHYFGGSEDAFATHFTEAVLTDKGLATLRRVPKSLDGEASFGERLNEKLDKKSRNLLMTELWETASTLPDDA